VTMGINNSTSVAGDSYDIVGRYVIDAVVHGFWATVPPRTPPGSGPSADGGCDRPGYGQCVSRARRDGPWCERESYAT